MGIRGDSCRQIHLFIEAADFRSAEKAWDADYFWTTGYQTNWRQSRVAKIYILATQISDGAVLQVIEMAQPSGLLTALAEIKTDYGKGSGSDRATRVTEFTAGITRKDGKALEEFDDLALWGGYFWLWGNGHHAPGASASGGWGGGP